MAHVHVSRCLSPTEGISFKYCSRFTYPCDGSRPLTSLGCGNQENRSIAIVHTP